jgi:hypothetical protein
LLEEKDEESQWDVRVVRWSGFPMQKVFGRKFADAISDHPIQLSL